MTWSIGGPEVEWRGGRGHVVGPEAAVGALNIEGRLARGQKRAEIWRANVEVDTGNGVVLVTDMFGGSPSNLSLMACAGAGRRIVYGANLPMLIKLAKSRDLPVTEAVAAALDAGRKYINSLDLGGGDAA